MKKILITGAGGFIGSHLTEMCVREGFEVKAFVRYNSKGHWGWLENSSCKGSFEVLSGDIRDYDSVHKALRGCASVIHLAALIGIPYSYISPKAYLETNVTGTYNILEASKELNISNLLITSTSETYGTAQYVPIDEQHPVVGQSPYSASKIAADQLAISYFRSFELPVKIVRPFNSYGPRQSARAIIPTIISQILAGERVLNVGNLHPTRDLTFVNDTCSGFLEIFKSQNLFGKAVNIGMNHEISIGELLTLIARLMNVNVEIRSDQQRIRPSKSEVERLCCNNQLMLSSTNWRPIYNLEKGLIETIEWLRQHINNYKPEFYNV